MPRTLSSPLPTLRRLAAASLVSLSLAAGAATPALTTQVPGYYRQALGGFSVTALYDGYIDLNTQLLKGIQADDLQRLLARMFLDNTRGVQTAVNAYLVHTGEQLVLVDTGAGQCFGPGLGSLLDNLRASGYAPEAVDAVLLTHLHPDHLCGLLDREGRAVFPNAKVWATQADADFWLSEQVAGAAPEAMRPFFKMAREAVAPYRTKGAFAALRQASACTPASVRCRHQAIRRGMRATSSRRRASSFCSGATLCTTMRCSLPSPMSRSNSIPIRSRPSPPARRFLLRPRNKAG